MILPNYYSILPANVRYCPELTDFEKILYSEITALTNAFGYCFASNNYFAELYKKNITTISKAISKLEFFEFIRIEVKPEEGNKRYIYITPIGKNANTPIGENANTPIGENAKSNNTSLNTTSLTYENLENVPNLQDLFNQVYSKIFTKKD